MLAAACTTAGQLNWPTAFVSVGGIVAAGAVIIILYWFLVRHG